MLKACFIHSFSLANNYNRPNYSRHRHFHYDFPFDNLGNAEIVAGPRSTAIQVGSSAHFNCSSSLPDEIHWFHYAIGANDRVFVYGYEKFYAPYEGRFELEKNDTAYNLVIPSVKLEDAGKYECQDVRGSGDKKSAQLTVLGT